jgi:hypothetical protein
MQILHRKVRLQKKASQALDMGFSAAAHSTRVAMLGQFPIQEDGKMQRNSDLKQPLRLFLLANACVALVTSGTTMLVLLIAPLGLAAVLSCTGLVAGLSFVLGVGADLWLWHGLNRSTKRSGASDPSGWSRSQGQMGLPPRTGSDDLTTRRNP